MLFEKRNGQRKSCPQNQLGVDLQSSAKFADGYVVPVQLQRVVAFAQVASAVLWLLVRDGIPET